MRKADRRPRVSLHHIHVFLLRNLGDRLQAIGLTGIEGIVDEDIHSPQLIDGLPDDALQIGVAHDVTGDREDAAPVLFDLLSRRLERLLSARTDANVRTVLGEHQRDCAPDSFGTSSNDRDLVFKCECGHGMLRVDASFIWALRDRSKPSAR